MSVALKKKGGVMEGPWARMAQLTLYNNKFSNC